MRQNSRNQILAEQTVQEADKLRAAPNPELQRQATTKYRIAAQLFRAAGEPEKAYDALRRGAEIAELSDRFPEAVDYLTTALALARRAKDDRRECQALLELGSLSAQEGKTSEGLQYSRQALELSRRASAKESEARSLLNLGKISYDANDIKAALEFLNQSLNIWRAVGDVNGQADALKYLGYSYTDLSELPRALDYYQQALSLYRQVHDQRGVAENTNAIGLVYALMGEREKAIENYSAAEQIFRACGDRHGLITALNGRGAVYAAIGSERALDCHNEALRLSREIGDLQGQVVALQFLGTTYRALGDRQGSNQDEQAKEQSYNRALECHTEALKLSGELKDRRVEAYVLQQLGSISSSLNKKKEAKSYYDRALTLSQQSSDRRGESISMDSLGTIAASLGRKKEALDYLRKALTLSQAAGDRARESATLFHLAHVNREAGHLLEARDSIEAAIEIVESLRTKVVSQDYRADYFAATREYYELLLDVLTQLNNESRRPDFVAETFRISEQARVRILLDSIKETHLNLREGVDAELLNQERKLGEMLDAKAGQLAQLKATSKIDEAEQLGDELRRLTTDYDEVRARIKAKSPRYASLTQPEAVVVSDVQRRLLDPDTMLLEYLLSDEHSYLWAITRNDAAVFELPGRVRIEQAVKRFYELLTAKQSTSEETFEQQQARIAAAQTRLPDAAKDLSDLILGPVAARLHHRRILIVADGALQYVPFQALVVSGQSQPLLAEHEVVNEPSASVLALVAENATQPQIAPNSVIVYADPVFDSRDPRVVGSRPASDLEARAVEPNNQLHEAFRDLGFTAGSRIPSLPASREEAQAIMSVAPPESSREVLGFEASRTSINEIDLSRYRIIHFATHGFVDYQHPELSGLVLSMVDEKGNPQDGFLRMHEIYNLRLPVDLVVLSACNTGLGKEVRGEGLIGLTRGFMYAGARGVVASLWKVDDDATAELMKQFYVGMFQRGLTPAAALRDAQLAVRSQKRWESPYYWAAFVIQGEYDQKQLARTPAYDFRVIAVATVLVALALGTAVFFRGKRRRIIRIE